MLDENNTSLVH